MKTALIFLTIFTTFVLSGCTSTKEGNFTEIPNMHYGHDGHSAIELKRDMVLITDRIEEYLSTGITTFKRDEIFSLSDQRFIKPSDAGYTPSALNSLVKGILSTKQTELNKILPYEQGFYQRTGFSSATLGDGNYVIAGGAKAGSVFNTVEFRSITGKNYINKFNMLRPRFLPIITVLKDKKILISGGKPDLDSKQGRPTDTRADLFDAKEKNLFPTMPMNTDRFCHTATLLVDGKVLIAGGVDVSDNATFVKSVELYDPKTNSFSIIGKTIYNHCWGTATLLNDGKVLITGGVSGEKFETPRMSREGTNTAELFDPVNKVPIKLPTMKAHRAEHSALKMSNDDTVLITGGNDQNTLTGESQDLRSAELFTP